jgi:hypothetical protein
MQLSGSVNRADPVVVATVCCFSLIIRSQNYATPMYPPVRVPFMLDGNGDHYAPRDSQFFIMDIDAQRLGVAGRSCLNVNVLI